MTIAFAAAFDYYNDSLYIDRVEVIGGSSTPADTTAPVVQLTSPNGGQNLTTGESATVRSEREKSRESLGNATTSDNYQVISIDDGDPIPVDSIYDFEMADLLLTSL
ncbi:MAG: hypothetical protein H0T47_01480 [Planctomycetaceae bacterium]|nr:hypothetical protein [Planctomycetaceae bacterium]